MKTDGHQWEGNYWPQMAAMQKRKGAEWEENSGGGADLQIDDSSGVSGEEGRILWWLRQVFGNPEAAFRLHEATPKAVAKFPFMNQFRNVRENIEVLLKLARRYQKEEDQMNRLAIERLKLNSCSRAPSHGHHFRQQFRGGVGNGHAKSDSCGHCRFALSHPLRDGFPVLGGNIAVGDEVTHQLFNGLPAVFRPQVNYLYV